MNDNRKNCVAYYIYTDRKAGMKFTRMKNQILSFLSLTAGAVLAAFALEEFLVPNKIFDGGITGVSMILTSFVPLKLGIALIVINIPFFIVGWRRMGKVFVLKAVYAIALFSVMSGVFESFQNATEEMLLAVTFGGVFLGAGVGLVLRGGGVLDGTEIVAILINRKWGISVGRVILVFNVVIYTVAGICFGLDRGMYSLLMYIITSRIIDMVESGLQSTKSVMIITEDGKSLADEIYRNLGRTVTFMQGTGLVSHENMDVLLCVVTRGEISELKRIIGHSKGSNFTTISEVSEIVGNHMKSIK